MTGLVGRFIPTAAGLNARLGTLVQFGLVVKIAAIAVFLAGYSLGTYASMENRFFSGMVRIQTERGYHVINAKPYSWIRHLGYNAGILFSLASPFPLESHWTFLPACLSIIVIIIRTNLEDKDWQQKLEGYRAYAEQVPYRLIPEIW